MNYTFVRAHPTSCPSVEGWWLKVNPMAEGELVDTLHHRVTHNAFMAFDNDPHIQKLAKNNPELYHPIRRGAGWISTMLKLQFAHELVLVNAKGGMCTQRGMTIVAELPSNKLEWPQKLENEYIYIQTFGDGQHFYLKSSGSRIFDPVKQDTLKAAKAQAGIYVDDKHIIVEQVTPDPKRKRDGD